MGPLPQPDKNHPRATTNNSITSPAAPGSSSSHEPPPAAIVHARVASPGGLDAEPLDVDFRIGHDGGISITVPSTSLPMSRPLPSLSHAEIHAHRALPPKPETPEETLFRGEVRRLAQIAIDVLAPLADDESCTRRMGDYAGMFISLLLLPAALAYIAIYIVILTLDACTCIRFLYLLSPLSLLEYVYAFLTHPIMTCQLFYRLGELKSKIKAHSRSNVKSQSVYVIPRDVFLAWNKFLPFEDARSQLQLVPLWKFARSGGLRDGVVAVSHKYAGEFADWNGDMYQTIKSVVEAESTLQRIFFDWSCVTHEKGIERDKMIRVMPNLFERAQVVPCVAGEIGEFAKQFRCSIWCQLECLTADDSLMSKFQLRDGVVEEDEFRNRQYTITDKNDLYLILPVWIERIACGFQKLEFLCGDQDKARLFLAILRWFVKWHDENHVVDVLVKGDVSMLAVTAAMGV